ncbi:MAG TPA: ribosome silencing factor [bacterium]
MNSEQLSRFIAELSLAKKAEDIIIMDLKKLISFADYFVICSADSDSQVKAISDHITEELKKQQVKVWHVEGYQASTWILMDLVDVVVHIFRPEVRKFYALEKLWGDAKITRVADQ